MFRKLLLLLLCVALLSAHSIAAPASAVMGLSFSADGSLLAAARQDGTVTLWRLSDKHVSATWQAHRDAVSSLAFSRDGRLLLTGSYDHSACLWETESHHQQASFSGEPTEVLAVSLAADGSQAAASCYSGVTRLWRRDGHEVGVLDGNCAAFGPQGLLATGDKDGKIRLYNDRGQLQVSWKAHDRVINALAWNAAGSSLATASGDHTVALWNRSTRRKLAVLSGHKSAVLAVAWSPNGKTLASAGTGGVILWDLNRPSSPLRATLPAGWVNSVAFSADGNTLAAGNARGEVQMWHVATARLERKMDSR